MPTFNLTASAFKHEIAPGRIIEAWGFNHSLPGPVIRAKKGETLIINVKNELPEPTLIHWHGIQLPATMDGTGHVQKPIDPGESFQYVFQAPDAGTFWYHSHFNETIQLERGLYGGIIIEDVNDPVTVDNDQLFLFDDMKLNEQNEFSRGNILERWMERHDGREGNTLLLNGKVNPVINVSAGQMERWRFVNSSSARYIRLSLGGKKFQLIATDGGLIEKAYITNEILITPGERVEIVVDNLNEGDIFPIETLPYHRMTMAVKAKRQQFAMVRVGEKKPSVAEIPQKLREIQPLASRESSPTREIKFSVGASAKRGIDFLVNDQMHLHDKPVRNGELQVWELRNTSMMDHPFHLHGFFFQVLDINGKQPEFVSWKDTINLPPRSRMKIAWQPDRAGEWMYHCHILEHHAAGMMGHFKVA